MYVCLQSWSKSLMQMFDCKKGKTIVQKDNMQWRCRLFPLLWVVFLVIVIVLYSFVKFHFPNFILEYFLHFFISLIIFINVHYKYDIIWVLGI